MRRGGCDGSFVTQHAWDRTARGVPTVSLLLRPRSAVKQRWPVFRPRCVPQHSRGSRARLLRVVMAPHLSRAELDVVQGMAAKQKAASAILARITGQRARKGVEAPRIGAIERAIAGRTFKRGPKETRGRKPCMTKGHVKALDKTRQRLIKQAKGEREVHWGEIIAKAGIPSVDPTTAARTLRRHGIAVAARPPREKPLRTAEHESERVRICNTWIKKPVGFFTDDVDLIMDNKHFEIPMSATAKRFAKVRRVRFHLRTRFEGTSKGFTKPSAQKQRVNPGGSVTVCAGIINCKVKLWHYLPKKWNGTVAAKTYRGPIARALRRCRGEKASYRILEDNDPTGYKSKAGQDAKRDMSIRPMPFPRFSPDLNPMDFFLWSEVQRRMADQSPPANETVEGYKSRLRRTAMRIPQAVIKKAVLDIRSRARAVAAAEGGDIARD